VPVCRILSFRFVFLVVFFRLLAFAFRVASRAQIEIIVIVRCF